MTTTKEPAAAGNYDSDFANERGAEEVRRELVFVGPSFPLSARPRTDIANEKSPHQKTIELIFAPAAAAIEIIKGTGDDTGDSFANAGYDPDEPRVAAGQTGGGQWTSGDAGAADRQAKRMKEAKRFALSAAEYRRIAGEESQNAPFEFGTGTEYERHLAAAKSARNIAEEMERRAYILAHGKEDDYRPLMLKKYGINNPELNKIAAYYAEKFNDQATLNWLKLQHPYVRSRKDDLNAIDSMAMMLMGGLVTDLDGAPQEGAGSLQDKTPFDQASNAETSESSKGHFQELGQDPATGKFRRAEAEAGARLESEVGVLRRDPSGNTDWIDTNGKTYDAVGPAPSKYFDAESFTNSINYHLNNKQGVDYIVVDTTGLTSEQRTSVGEYVKTLPATQQRRIIMQ